MSRHNDNPLNHHNTAYQRRRVKLKVLEAKIIWLGRLQPSDKQKLLTALNLQR